VRRGALRKLLTLEQRPVGFATADAEGAPNAGWLPIGTIRGNVQTLNARERIQAAQAEVELTHVVEIGYRSDIDQAVISSASASGHNMRLRWGARILNVTGVLDPDGRRHSLQVTCVEHEA
jgi:SPP1 family predicted phage head-tail adaptor